MPRLPDPNLESKILDAAHKLWKKGGEKSLTMRAVAKAAETNTPAVYRRFRDRDDILRALLQRFRLDIAAHLEGVSSLQEACERYLDYALSHPREYELFFQREYELFYSARAMRAGVKPVAQPVRDAMTQTAKQELGESPDGHQRFLLGVRMLVNGAAMLLVAKVILPKDREKARTAFSASMAALRSQADKL